MQTINIDTIRYCQRRKLLPPAARSASGYRQYTRSDLERLQFIEPWRRDRGVVNVTMTVSELADRAGVPAHVVRFYTREGLLKPRRNRTNGYRHYSEADVTRLRFIRRAKSLGFTLDDIGQILRDSDRRQSPCPRTRSLIVKRLQEAEERLSALRELQDRMNKAVDLWRRMPDRAPDGQSVCHLIEAVTDDDALDRALD